MLRPRTMKKLMQVGQTGRITPGQAQFLARRGEKAIKRQAQRSQRRVELEQLRDREVARLEAAQQRGRELGR